MDDSRVDHHGPASTVGERSAAGLRGQGLRLVLAPPSSQTPAMSRRNWTKLAAAWLLYAVLHLGLGSAPEPILLLLGCPNESLFQHMKMAFFSYSLVSLCEIALSARVRRPGPLAARATAAVLYSYLALILWLPLPIVFGLLESTALEVGYSCVVLAVCLAVVLAIEERLEQPAEAARAFIAAATLAWGVSLFVFSILAFEAPPLDVFEDPATHHHSAGETG